MQVLVVRQDDNDIWPRLLLERHLVQGPDGGGQT